MSNQNETLIVKIKPSAQKNKNIHRGGTGTCSVSHTVIESQFLCLQLVFHSCQ